MITSNEHFISDKKVHTEIKHKLFYDTFNAILGISAKFSENNSFTYIDLYAGQGKFNDESFGSPMLALNTILESSVIDSFHQVKCFFSEIDEESYSELEKNILDLKNSKQYNQKVTTVLHNGSWSENNHAIDELLKYSKWGFIFMDPFSNEIDLDKLLELLIDRTKFKDFMIFINMQSIKRIIGRYPNHEGVARFLGVEVSNLKNIAKSNELISNCLRDRFSLINKDYMIHASIPTTREGKIVDKDNFQLLLGTNSVGVSDIFLVSYIEALKEFKSDFRASLFDSISDDIIKIIKENSSISLNVIIQQLYKNYNSWKYAEMNNIPISKNVHSAVNSLIKNNQIQVSMCPEEFKNKDKTISYKAFSRNKFMKEIILK
jgi:three-Cys-motif partner protein